MMLTAKLKLLPIVEQHAQPLQTMERCNEACSKVSVIAFHERNWNRVKLQKQCYHGVKDEFRLSGQQAILVTRKVAHSYRTDIENLRIRDRMREIGTPPLELVQHKFRKHGAVAYDARCLSWKGRDRATILTLSGRVGPSS